MFTRVKTHPVLMVIHKEDRMVFSLDLEVTVGRTVEADIHIPHSQVSRHQAVIRRTAEGRYLLIDGDGQGLGSRNGTYVNWERVQHHYLEVGDVICFGSPAAVAQFGLSDTLPTQIHPDALIQRTDHLSTQIVVSLGN